MCGNRGGGGFSGGILGRGGRPGYGEGKGGDGEAKGGGGGEFIVGTDGGWVGFIEDAEEDSCCGCCRKNCPLVNKCSGPKFLAFGSK